MRDEELLYLFDLYRNKYNLHNLYDFFDLLLYSITKYLKTSSSQLEETKNNETFFIQNISIFINEYQNSIQTIDLNNTIIEDYDSFEDERYTKLYNLLNKDVYMYDIKYCDLIIMDVMMNPNISTIHLNKIKKIISNVFLNKPDRAKLLIKRIELLIYDSYQNLMNVYSHNLIDLNMLFNVQYLNIILGYFLIIGQNEKLKRNDYWNLLDISLNYVHQLIKFLNSQIAYNEILIKNFESDGLFVIITKQKSYLVGILKKVFDKMENFMVNNPKNIEEYRIFYNLFELFNSELKYNHPRNQFIKFKQLQHQNHYSEYLAQSYIYALNYNLSRRPYKNYLINYRLILENSNILLNENNYHVIDNNIQILSDINKLFERIIILNPNIQLEDTNLVESWKNKYYNYIFYLLDKLTLASSRLISFTKKYNYSESRDIVYYDYQIFTLDVFFISKIIKELSIITRNILNKNINFDNLPIEKYILTIFRLFTDDNFTNLFVNLFERKFRLTNNFKVRSRKVIFNDFHKIIKSKKEVWTTIISYLEIDYNRKIEIINKLVQIKFNYNQLETIYLNDFNESYRTIFNKFLDNSYQEKLDTYLEEFGDPFTNEMIKNPMTLPITGQIVDKDVILKILRNKPCNPFNNLPLSIEELDEYNQKSDIKTKNQSFMEKLEKIKLELDSLL